MKGFPFVLTILFFALVNSVQIDPGLLQSPQGVRFSPSSSNDGFGSYVSRAGDVNGDGIDDILISDITYQSDCGKVYVIFGSSKDQPNLAPENGLTPSRGFSVLGLSASKLGICLTDLGDVNKDGIDDFAVVSYQDKVIYVIYGRKDDSSDILIGSTFQSLNQGFKITTSNIPQSSIAPTIERAGDVNKDGMADLLVGFYETGTSPGCVFVIYGRKGDSSPIDLVMNLNPQLGFIIQGVATHLFGVTMSSAGDLNNDKFGDLILGSYFGNKVYVIYGKASRTQKIDLNSPLSQSDGFIVAAPSSVNQFGSSISEPADMNGDGIADLLIGGYGTSFIIYGDEYGYSDITIGSTSKAVSVVTHSGYDICYKIFSAGDMNSDGVNDLGIICEFSGPTDPHSFVIYGSPLGISSLTVPDVLQTDPTMGLSILVPYYQYQFSGVGDFNNDFLPDLIVSSQTYDPSAYVSVIYGSNGCQTKNCSKCAPADTCLACFGGLGLYKSECVNCPKGTYLSEANCVDCPNGCFECKSASVCSSCMNDYVLVDSQCINKGKSLQENITGAALDGTAALGSGVAIGSSLPTNFGLVAKILRNLRYINVTVSTELEETFKSWKISSGMIGVPGSLRDESNSDSLPDVFKRYHVGALFLVNYWKSLMMILIGMAVFAPFKALEVHSSKSNKFRSIARSINIVASNFTLTQLYGSLDDIIFYFVLQAKPTISDSNLQKLSLCVAMLLLFIAVMTFLVHSLIIQKYQGLKTSGQNLKSEKKQEFLLLYENYKMLFIDFQDTFLIKQSFLMIYVGRSILSGLLITKLFEYPLLQTLLLTALNILILVYLFIYKPFKESINMWGQYFCEALLLLVNVSMFGMAIIGEMAEKSEEAIKAFSKIIIVLNMVLIFGSLFFMILMIIKTIYVAYQAKKASKNQQQQGTNVVRLRNEEVLDQSINDQFNLSRSQIFTESRSSSLFLRNMDIQNKGDGFNNIKASQQALPSPSRSPEQRPGDMMIIRAEQQPQFGTIGPVLSGSIGLDHQLNRRKRAKRISRPFVSQKSTLKNYNETEIQTNYMSKPSSTATFQDQKETMEPGFSNPLNNFADPNSTSLIVSARNSKAPTKSIGFSPPVRNLEKSVLIESQKDSEAYLSMGSSPLLSHLEASATHSNMEQDSMDLSMSQKPAQKASKYFEVLEESRFERVEANASLNIDPKEESQVVAPDQDRDYEKFLRRKVNENSAAFVIKKWQQKNPEKKETEKKIGFW